MSDTEQEPAAEEKPTYVTAEDLEKFSDKMASHFGRIVSKQMEEKYMPQIKENQIDPDKFKEQLSTELLTDPESAFNKMMDQREASKKSLSDKKRELVKEEMKNFKDEPFYSEIEEEVEKLAEAALNKGFPPGPAVELGFEKAKSNYIINRDPDLKLSMAPPGTPRVREKKVKIPVEFKEAAQRDINSGLFKDEAEYVANLSPQIKAKYGL